MSILSVFKSLFKLVPRTQVWRLKISFLKPEIGHEWISSVLVEFSGFEPLRVIWSEDSKSLTILQIDYACTPRVHARLLKSLENVPGTERLTSDSQVVMLHSRRNKRTAPLTDDNKSLAAGWGHRKRRF